LLLNRAVHAQTTLLVISMLKVAETQLESVPVSKHACLPC